jgi:hypothetical protein
MTQTITTGSVTTVTLPAGKRLTVTAGDDVAIVVRYYNSEVVESTSLSAEQEVLYGAYFKDMVFSINALSGPVTYAITQSTDPVRAGVSTISGGTINGAVIGGTTPAAITGTVITANTRFAGPIDGTVGAITPAAVTGTTITASTGFVGPLNGSIGGTTPSTAAFVSVELPSDVLLSTNAGIPEDAVQGALTVNPAGAENAITYTAVDYGAVGNAITIAYVDPEDNDAVLGVDVNGTAITVNLATGEAGAITSTAAQIKTAIEAEAAAAALVTMAFAADGGLDDGSGVVTAMSLANLAGGEGLGIGTMGKGSLVADTTNGKLYINGGTKAVPVWKLVTSAA